MLLGEIVLLNHGRYFIQFLGVGVLSTTLLLFLYAYIIAYFSIPDTYQREGTMIIVQLSNAIMAYFYCLRKKKSAWLHGGSLGVGISLLLAIVLWVIYQENLAVVKLLGFISISILLGMLGGWLGINRK